MEKFSSATDFRLRSVKIYPHGVDNYEQIQPLISKFEYTESVTSPFVTATLVVVDSTGLLQKLPIKGGEKVEVEVFTNIQEEAFRYQMVVWKVANRFAEQKKQVYTLGLISAEALDNELIRIQTPVVGNPEAIIAKYLKGSEFLNTSKEFFSEPSKFKVQMLPPRMRPFDLFASLAIKSVPVKSTKAKSASSNSNETRQNIRGTGGFFFWETFRGYNFFAVDSLCADEKSDLKSDRLQSVVWGSKPDEPYTERLGNIGDGADDRFTIKRSIFASEVDMMDSLRKGKHSSLMVFFNHSTGQYAERVYSIQESYDSMAHLGGQESISYTPIKDKDLSDYPSRTMSIYLDHETWYNGPGPASPDPSDKSDSPTEFADWQMFYSAQSLARYQLLQNQSCMIVIPGNAAICAGDRINIRLVNKMPDVAAKDEPFDLESSGEYLIQETTHTYDPTDSANGTFYTTLRLMRDSYGMKKKESAHDQ